MALPILYRNKQICSVLIKNFSAASILQTIAGTSRARIRQLNRNNIPTFSFIPSHSFKNLQTDLDSFLELLGDTLDEITDVKNDPELLEVTDRFKRMLQYHKIEGHRGKSFLENYKLLEDPENLTPVNLKLASILGHCTEMFVLDIVLVDDVLDNGKFRRGSPCWYLQPGIGLSAFNDVLMIEKVLFAVLKKYFRSHPFYFALVDQFNDILTFHIGHSLDLMCLDPDGRPRLQSFTPGRLDAMIRFKTAKWYLQLHVALSMYFAGIGGKEEHQERHRILYEMGYFMNVQNDYVDCFGITEQKLGKPGTDIQEGKCVWPIVTALQRASPAQRKLLEQHYGRSEPESAELVKDLYVELKLPEIFSSYRQRSLENAIKLINQISTGLPKQIFFDIMRDTYNEGNTMSFFNV